MNQEPNKVIFSMVGVNKTHNQKEIIRDISLSYFYGAKIGVLGLNGAGKSTVLRIMAGEDKEFEGEVHLSKGYTVGYLPQEPELDETKTVMENVELGVGPTKALLDEFEEIGDKFATVADDDEMNQLIERQGELQEKIDALNAWDLSNQLEMAMDALRCPPGDSAVEHLSGGEKRRVALCRLLLEKPDILLLDEPTNHLDAETVGWLEQHLQRYEGTVIAVTHDRYFLDNVAGWILELDHGHGIPWKGNYSSWLDQKQKRLADEKKQDLCRQKALARELEWVKKSPQGRRAKNKARLNNYENLLNQENEQRAKEVQIFIPPGRRLGSKVIEAKNLTKAYGDKLLFENLSFSLPPAGIVGIIGANGAGKTTLFRLLVGEEQPDSGSLEMGDTVDLSYVDQSRSDLEAGKTVWEVVSEGNEEINLGGVKINSRAYLTRFSFKGQEQQKIVEKMSGGERNRVHLAKLLKQQSNLILLDEPTNDLDVNTIRAMEEALETFAGCALIISHDRWFLDRVATHILAFEGNSEVLWFEGNYQAYEEDRKKRLGHKADQPHRIKYRKLSRN